MAQRIREFMTPHPRTLEATATVVDAAKLMRDEDVGAVMATAGDAIRGIVTDRDIALRVVAEGTDPSAVTIESICTSDVVTVSPDDSVDDAIRTMSERAIRRLPVVENGQPVGIVSIGDLAVRSNGERALEDISAAPPNN